MSDHTDVLQDTSALHRREHQDWIRAEWGAAEDNRRARFYSLMRAGRRRLAIEGA